MREILFHGKRLDNGEWVEGWYQPEIICSDGYSYGVTLCYKEPDGYLADVEVDPDTVGEYTGQTDKNGKKIFEWDIVKFTRFNALGYATSRIGYVRYFDRLPVFYIMASTGDAWDWCDCEEIEVIGNIHDNPELLEGEE